MKKYLFIITFGLLAVVACSSDDDDSSSSGSASGAAVTGVTCSSATSSSLTFTWNEVDNITGYQALLNDADGNKVEQQSVYSGTATFSSLSASTTYSFTVRYVYKNSSGATTLSEWSTAVSATTSASSDSDSEENDSSTDYYDDFLIPDYESTTTALAFPGAEGGGMYTTGGRGGTVYHVTNLNDSGSGSLREAVSKSGARIIVFDVAGVIELESTLKISNGDLTIAGQTAPYGGICLKNYACRVAADNVIIRFIHFRMGDEKETEDDAIWGRYYSNIILDHCSMSWSTDECASFYGNEYFTMQWCILTESLTNSVHDKGSHGYGGIWGGNNASFHHNMLANHNNRTPRFDHPGIYENPSSPDKRGVVDYRNNVNFNWGTGNGCYGGEAGLKINMVNNYYKMGSASKDRGYFIEADGVYTSSGTSYYGYPYLYMSGNSYYNSSGVEQTIDETKYPSGVYWADEDESSITSDGHIVSSAHSVVGQDDASAYITTHSASDAFSLICSIGGCSLYRDAVDERAVTDATNGYATYTSGGNGSTGGLIDSQSYVGGWPDYTALGSDNINNDPTDSDGDGMSDWFEDAFGLDKSSASDASTYTLDSYGRYTNLDMYLHYLVKDIVAEQAGSGTYAAQ